MCRANWWLPGMADQSQEIVDVMLDDDDDGGDAARINEGIAQQAHEIAVVHEPVHQAKQRKGDKEPEKVFDEVPDNEQVPDHLIFFAFAGHRLSDERFVSIP